MAARTVSRCLARRFSSGGKALSEEEKAAENVFIKKAEKEKLEKLARKGSSKPGEAATSEAAAAAAGEVGGSPVGGSSSTATGGVSTDKNRNYGVIAGAIAISSALGWYLLSRNPKKSEDPSSSN